MLIILSPAKKLDFKTPSVLSNFSQPDFIEESHQLVKKLSKLSVGEIAKFMKISPQLALVNHERFQSWTPNNSLSNSKQAILAFKGDVYTGLKAEEFSSKEIKKAQNSIRILSGLYGVLRPLDLIQPYRLEMGRKLENPKGSDLYSYWGDKITNHLNDTLEGHRNKILINLASNEYFKSIQTKKLQAQVITPIFKDLKQGQYKVISFYAKKARGMMCRFIIQNKLTKAEDIKAFNDDGYYFNSQMSKDKEWVFTRER